jgi:very-short-patch-repair endonuclease
MPSRGEKSTKSAARATVGAEIPRQEEFFARVVSLDAICALCHRVETTVERSDHPGRAVDPDRFVAWVATQQLALITTAQLLACGVGRTAIARRVRKGLLHRVHQGVYLFGARMLQQGARELAAVLACGASTFVSHRSATAAYRLAGADNGGVHITVVARSLPQRPGITSHRVPELHPDDISVWRGSPITSPARTPLDFAGQAEGDELERAIAEAYALNLTTEKQLRAVLDRYPHRTGAGRLRAELDREQGPAWTRSEAERRMKLLLRQAGLPTPQTNRKIAGFQADFVWPDQRLIVEVDGFQFHGHRRAFERDRKRDAAHVLAGYRVIRITWRRLTEEPIAVAVTIARALALAA